MSKFVSFAPSNIALIKYWGKRDKKLNLPINSSLSVSLGKFGTKTSLQKIMGKKDEVFFNGKLIKEDDDFYQKIVKFVDLVRRENQALEIRTENNIPTAAGLASSASGFAALTLALNECFDLKKNSQELSILARMGSGSACRSIFDGFVRWNKGVKSDGSDSFAEKIELNNLQWKNFCIGILELETGKKAVSSRDGMNVTTETSILYRAWPEQVTEDLAKMSLAIENNDFELLGKTAEHNALSMHATMISAVPPIIYWSEKTLITIKKVHELRLQGLSLYFTIDAGANLKLLFEKKNEQSVLQNFPCVKIVKPFA